MSEQTEVRRLQALPYHERLATFLRSTEPGLWEWMAAGRIAAQSEQLRHELLRSDLPAHSGRARGGARCCGARVGTSRSRCAGLAVPDRGGGGGGGGDVAANAALVFVPDEAIVLLSGPILDVLDPAELSAVLGHELAHHVLWTIGGGRHLVTDRLVAAMLEAADTTASGRTLAETSRRLALTTELFADRGSLIACADLHVAVAALVKSATGLRTVSPSAYLAQADEVIASSSASSAAVTHPETFIRAAALRDWERTPADPLPVVDRFVQGPLDVDHLDLLDQAETASVTRSVIEGLLAPSWMRTDANIGHARGFFPDFVATDVVPFVPLAAEVASTRRYYAYVLLDFAMADPDLDGVALVEVLAAAHRLGMVSAFLQVVDTELRLSARSRARLLADAEVRAIELGAGVAPAGRATPGAHGEVDDR